MDDITLRVVNDDTVVIANDNTTIGYATFEKASVTAHHRRTYDPIAKMLSPEKSKTPDIA